MFENEINVLGLNIEASYMHQNNYKSYKYLKLSMIIEIYGQIIEK
jgi:hypothetical protein